MGHGRIRAVESTVERGHGRIRAVERAAGGMLREYTVVYTVYG